MPVEWALLTLVARSTYPGSGIARQVYFPGHFRASLLAGAWGATIVATGIATSARLLAQRLLADPAMVQVETLCAARRTKGAAFVVDRLLELAATGRIAAVVAGALPPSVLRAQPVRWLLAHQHVPLCSYALPVMHEPERRPPDARG